MRKILAILLLMLIVFNTIGYKLWFSVAMDKADIKLEAALDKDNYNEEQLFTLKIPINLPYQNIGNSSERISGEIIINGETYRYVKRRVANDTLFLACIRNTEKINLQQKSNDYFGKVNDLSGSNNVKKFPGKNNNIVKFASSDFTNDILLWKCVTNLNASIVYVNSTIINNSSEHLQKLIKPPELV